MSGENGEKLRKLGEGLKRHSPSVYAVLLAFSDTYKVTPERFSRLARSATPSPLRMMSDRTWNPYDYFRREDTSVQYLILS